MQTARNVLIALLTLMAVGVGAKLTDVPPEGHPDSLPPNTVHVPGLGVEP